VLGRVIDMAAFVGSRLPARLTRSLAMIGGTIEWAARPGKRAQLATNLAHAAGADRQSRQVRRLVRHEFLNEARRSADLLWAIGKPHEFLESVEIVGAEHASAAAAGGHGLVLAGIHIGGWELAVGVPAAIVPVPTTVIVADDWLAWGIQHVRAAVGLGVVYRSTSPLAALRLLSRGEALLVLGDDASGPPPRRHLVPFCDSDAALPAGIVSLARLAGAPIVPFSVLPLGPRRWQVTFEEPIDPPDRGDGEVAEPKALAELAARWTSVIRANPSHWAARFPIAWEEEPS
jgi:lauroyl/myristoyl acyltransferase